MPQPKAQLKTQPKTPRPEATRRPMRHPLTLQARRRPPKTALKKPPPTPQRLKVSASLARTRAANRQLMRTAAQRAPMQLQKPALKRRLQTVQIHRVLARRPTPRLVTAPAPREMPANLRPRKHQLSQSLGMMRAAQKRRQPPNRKPHLNLKQPLKPARQHPAQPSRRSVKPRVPPTMSVHPIPAALNPHQRQLTALQQPASRLRQLQQRAPRQKARPLKAQVPAQQPPHRAANLPQAAARHRAAARPIRKLLALKPIQATPCRPSTPLAAM